MEIFIVVSATLFLAAFIILTVYFIQTLIQIKHTARAVEILARHLDAEVSKADRMSDAVSGMAEGVGKIAGTFLSYVAGAFSRMFGGDSTDSKQHEGTADSKQAAPPAR